MREVEHVVRCGWPADVTHRGTSLHLCAWAPRHTLRLQIQDLDRKLAADIPNRLIDLLEIAAYVHCTDQSVSRGGLALRGTGADWRRRFRLVVQVREPELWTSLGQELSDLLAFLTDDTYAFEFEHLQNPPPRPIHFTFSDAGGASFEADEVMLFSGGLDSLAGALDALVDGGKRVTLVSHCSSTKIVAAQKRIAARLRERCGADKVLHIPVIVQKTDAIPDNDSMQRSRSFLFAALGVTAAHAFGLDRFRFYENGVVSLNLPIAGHVLGARATRTTHPQVLQRFAGLFSNLLERTISIDNPFVWKTKGEVVAVIDRHGGSHLIASAVSCARVRDRSSEKPHCGVCSQCLSRRFAILAMGLEQYDPTEAYDVDLLIGERPPGLARLMAETFVRFASEIETMGERDFVARYPELWRAAPYLHEPLGEVIASAFALHRRHAAELDVVLERGIALHAAALRRNSVPGSLLLLTLNAAQPLLTGPPSGEVFPDPAEPSEAGVTETWASFDPVCERVEISGAVGILAGASYGLLKLLKDERDRAVANGRGIAEIPFIPVSSLAKRLGLSSAAVRKRIERLRSDYRAIRSTSAAPLVDDLLETPASGGCRLSQSLRTFDVTAPSGDVTGRPGKCHRPAA